jgi:hypothetical protein
VGSGLSPGRPGNDITSPAAEGGPEEFSAPLVTDLEVWMREQRAKLCNAVLAFCVLNTYFATEP